MKSDRVDVLAIFAHPDDEVFRCGATLSLLADKGARVKVVSLSSGQAGSCGSPPLCSREDLGEFRRKELVCSCRVLGLAEPLVLDFQDGHFDGADEKEAILVINQLLEKFEPQIIITWPEHGISGHLDHCMVSQWVSSAVEKKSSSGGDSLAAIYHVVVPRSVAHELGMAHLHTQPDDRISVSIPVKEKWRKKMDAIHCHKTQAGESPILQASEEKKKLFLGQEHFLRVTSNKDSDLLLVLNQDQQTGD